MRKLENYWPTYKDCPECGQRQKNNKAYFKCKDSNCGYTEKSYIINSKREQRVKPVAEEIVGYLLGDDPDFNEPPPQVSFPDENIITCDKDGILVEAGDYVNEPGWYLENYFARTINIPQKTLYLPNREITEVASHESAHAATRLGHRDEKWHLKYMNYRQKAFSKFSSFVNEPDDEARYTLNFNKDFYKKNYGYNLEDLKYDPNED